MGLERGVCESVSSSEMAQTRAENIEEFRQASCQKWSKVIRGRARARKNISRELMISWGDVCEGDKELRFGSNRLKREIVGHRNEREAGRKRGGGGRRENNKRGSSRIGTAQVRQRRVRL